MHRSERRRLTASALVTFTAALFTTGCSGPMAKIEALRDALITGDATTIREKTASYPTCADVPPKVTPAGKPGPHDAGCLTDIATALGSKRGYVAHAPDHAAAATAALILARDGRGDWLTQNSWLEDLKTGQGTGHDALRLAVAFRMTEAAPIVGRRLVDEGALREALRAVVGAVPSACPTYWLLGSGADPKSLPPELDADHAACVQKDLSRRDGPGGTYGAGTPRAMEGAIALWREAERALRLGLPNAEAPARARLEKSLAAIEEATRKIETVKVESPRSSVTLGAMHEDAGVPFTSPAKDAGAASPSRTTR